MSYTVTKSRVLQYIGIILILCLFGGAYWYFKVYGSTLNQSQNDLNTNGLVGLWSFNGDDISGTTAYDRSGSGNNGTLTNGPAVTQGKVGQALDFDGTNDYVSTADYSYSNAQAFTMSVWFKADTVSGNQVIFSKTTYEYNLRLTDATLAFAYWDTGGVGVIDLSYSNVVANRWYLVDVTYDGSGAAYMYVNGVRVASDTNIVNTFQNKAEALLIGGGYHISGNPGYLNGQIDEMRIYNRAITASEVIALYAQGGGTKSNTSISQPQGTGRLDSGLAGYWPLDNGSGTSATNSSTNGNTGTLTNGPTWGTGQVGSAVTFDGTDDYITSGSPSTLDDMTAYTVTAWIAPDAVGASGVAKVITKSGTGFSSGWAINMCSNEGTLCSGVSNTLNFSVAFGTPGRWRTSADSVSLGQWNFIAVSYNRSSLSNNPEIYINGILRTVTETTSPASAYVSDASANLIIGNNSDGTHDFDGSIDEVRIYDRQLSSYEVSQLYRLNSPTSVDTGLKGYWSFNAPDMASTTAYDRSGAGNTGTLTGGPTITEGKLAQGLNFDGSDDYVSVADTAALTQSALTLSFWKKNTNAASNSNFLTKSGGSNRS